MDELGTGLLPASAADVARDLCVPSWLAAGGIITAFHVLALFVEAPLLAWGERVSARRFSSCALAVLALASLGAALSGSPWALIACLALYGPASGCALAASEGLLVESRPHERERTMTRLGLAGALGDLAVPALLGALSWWGLGWQAAMLGAATGIALLALVHGSARELERPLRFPEDEDAEESEDEEPAVLDALRLAFSTRPLLYWTLAAMLTNLLDEVLIAFTMIQLEAALPLERAVAVGAWTVGLVGGLAVLERTVMDLEPRRVLLISSVVTALSLTALASSTDVRIAIPAAFVLGVSSSPLHPLASARAYASLPGRPALVNAVASAFAPFDAISPLLLSALALAFGPPAALLAILIAPLGILFAAWRGRASHREEPARTGNGADEAGVESRDEHAPR